MRILNRAFLVPRAGDASQSGSRFKDFSRMGREVRPAHALDGHPSTDRGHSRTPTWCNHQSQSALNCPGNV